MHLNACEPHPKPMWHPPFTGIRLPAAVRVWIGRGLEQTAAAVQRLLGPMRSACGPSVDAQTPSWPAPASVARLCQGCGCPTRLLCRMRSTQNRLIGRGHTKTKQLVLFLGPALSAKGPFQAGLSAERASPKSKTNRFRPLCFSMAPLLVLGALDGSR